MNTLDLIASEYKKKSTKLDTVIEKQKSELFILNQTNEIQNEKIRVQESEIKKMDAIIEKKKSELITVNETLAKQGEKLKLHQEEINKLNSEIAKSEKMKIKLQDMAEKNLENYIKDLNKVKLELETKGEKGENKNQEKVEPAIIFQTSKKIKDRRRYGS